MFRFTIILLIFVFAFSVNDIGKHSFILNWEASTSFSNSLESVGFEGCEYLDQISQLPYFVKTLPISNGKDFYVELENPVFEQINGIEGMVSENMIPNKINVHTSSLRSGSSQHLYIEILPFRREGDKYFRLTKFDLKYIPKESSLNAMQQFNWKSASVLANGSWVKIATTSKGIHKIPYSTLGDWGFSNPQNVNIFGNNGYMLSENNSEIEYDGLQQLSTWKGKDNGGNDCLFFFSTGNTKWGWDEGDNKFRHKTNVYATSTYYFLSENVGNEKPVGMYDEVVAPETNTTSTFDEYALHEIEKYNLIRSGKKWYGENFIRGSSKNVSFNLSGRVTDSPVEFTINGVARSSTISSLNLNVNNTYKDSLYLYNVDITSASGTYAREDLEEFEFTPGGENVSIDFTYNASNSSAIAWLDYVELNYKRNISFIEPELFFRDVTTVGEGNVTLFEISNANSNLKVFDVSGITDVVEVPYNLNGNTINFKRGSNDLKEYVVFNPTGDFPTPEKVSDIENQNLHAGSNSEMVIISHPDFIAASNEIAEFHKNYDGMDVLVVKSTEVYNEFSSGMADATGIKRFIKMSRDKNSNLKYILLVGDGTYDNRNILGESHNFIPTYQANNSLLPTNSFVTDDYFVILDEGESVFNGAVDLGIGRIPCSTTREADIVVDKIKNYYSSEALGNWRNIVCFIADDQDGGNGTEVDHMEDSETLANKVNEINGAFVTDKIYFDAYPEESTTAGERYPDVTDAINERVKDGVLILNYVGHANERFMADEHVLDVSNINSWTNENNLPIFVTATCEFSRFDDDEMSAGEYILFNPNGGGIGLFSTTRLVFSSSNFNLSKSFYNTVFAKGDDGKNLRLGDIMKNAKVGAHNSINKRSFSLMADPALRLSYPEFNIVTTTINQNDAHGDADTITALNEVVVTGYVADFQGNKLVDFNGELTPVVYDKSVMLQTLGNDGGLPVTFKVQDNVIYKGLASVTSGEFSFSFVVPKDISYNLGEGKIIYYAQDGSKDANGAFENFYIGGSSNNQVADNTGPQVQLYLDNTDFISGGQTSANPLLLAYISDENGINTVGTGIGHDITAVLDGDYSNSIVLNSYYQADLDNYKSGKVEYPLSGLSVGKHTLKLKVWDVANNSSEVEIEFIVNNDLKIEEISNYPNPVTNSTDFIFTHNQPNELFETHIQVIDRNGRTIDSFYKTIPSSGTKSVPINWDPQSKGIRMMNGLYLYQITIKASDGSMASKAGKMLFVK